MRPLKANNNTSVQVRFWLRPVGLHEDDLPLGNSGIPTCATLAHPEDNRGEIPART